MKRLITCILFVPYMYCVPPVFSTLSELQQYASQMDEYPPIDNTTWANPDYTTYLRRTVPSYWEELLFKAGLRSWPLWNIHGFNDLLQKMVKFRENNGYIGRFVLKMQPLIGSSYIIWGDVQGAFHSLVRVLTKLYNDGLINERLEIIRPYIYFVFNGDLINRSAYSLEALTVIMRLMDRNPDKVFYIRGNHEDRDHWRNFNLKRDLVIRAATLSDEEVPLGHYVSRFFDTLPLALYLIGQEDDKDINVVRLSHYDRGRTELDEETFSGFFKRPHSQKTTIFKLGNSVGSNEKKVHIRAIVRGESRSTLYRPTPGLSQLEADKGATAWTLLSSPIESYRYLQDFYFDAFGILDVGKTLNDWTITLYNQDVRELLGFKKVAIYNLVTGLREFKAEKASVDVDPFVVLQKQYKSLDEQIEVLEDTCQITAQSVQQSQAKAEQTSREAVATLGKQKRIIIGSTLDTSGSIQEIGKSIQAGLQLAIDDINESGGIAKKPIQLVVLDDGYKPKQALKNIAILRDQYNTDLILNPVGTPTLNAYLDKVKSGDILVLFPTTGSMKFRQPDLTHIINLRASDNDTAKVVAQYMLDPLKVESLAIVYQDDDYGRGALKAIEQLFQEKGVSNLKAIPYTPNISDVSEPVQLIKNHDTQGILFVSTPLIARNIIKQFDVGFFAGKHLGGTSDMGEEYFQKFVKEKGLRFIVGDVMPNVHTSSLPIVQEFRERAKVNNIILDAFSLEAFIDAKLLAHVLKNINGEITQDKIIKEFEGIRDVDFGGLNLSFDPQKRQLLHTIWLDSGKGEIQEIKLSTSRDQGQKIEGDSRDMAVRANEIVFGTTLDVSKGVKAVGIAMKDSINATVNTINRQGGVNGKRLQVIFLDDEYEPALARKNIQHFLDGLKTNYILNPTGSATTRSYLDLIKNGTLLVLFPISGAAFLRDAQLTNLLNYRVSYLEEMKALTAHIMRVHKPKKIAVFYQNDSFGLTCLAGVKEGLSDLDDVILKEVSYKRNDVNFNVQTKILREFNPDAIAFCSTSIAAKGLIRQLDMGGLQGKSLWGVSDLGEDVFQNFIRDKGLTFYVANILPNPATSNIEIAKDFRALAKEAQIMTDIFAFEAYVNTMLTAFLISNVEGEVNKEKIIRFAESLNKVDFKGLELTFNPRTRELSNGLWISKGDGSPWTLIPVLSNMPEESRTQLKEKKSKDAVHFASGSNRKENIIEEQAKI